MEHIEFKPYLDQNYEEIKNNCLQEGSLFEDDQFPASDESLIRFTSRPDGVEWKRAKDLVEDPKFIVNNGRDNACDIGQGILGDCWFLAAAAAISNIPEFFQEVVPQDQSFDDGDYCGIFHFRFWRYGEWYDVVIDDYLPVGPNGLIYCRNKKCKNEFWVALLEKAYAKLNTCYEFLKSGKSQDAMIDMTGGVKETIVLREVSEDEIGKKTEKDPEALWKFLNKAVRLKSVCGACIKKENENKVKDYGLVVQHAYTVTKVAKLDDETKLIRVRNPWGNDKEWTGAWSDKSSEWNNVPNHEKKRLGLVIDSDGEFWMSFEEFIEYFDFLEIVHVNLNAFFKQVINKKANEWDFRHYIGCWTSGENAGGVNCKEEQFWSNPQYEFSLDETEKLTTMIGCLMQIGSRENRENTGGKAAEKAIQLHVFRVKDDEISSESEDENDYGTAKYTSDQVEFIASTQLTIVREVVGRFNLKAGTYIAVPCIQDGQDISFLLRIFIQIED